MINDIRNAFLDNLKNLTWMDSETRAAAINKANAITDMIGERTTSGFCHSRPFPGI